MKPWQRYWLYLALSWSTIHIFRDIFQDLEIKNFLSTMLVKQRGYRLPFPWRSWVTYVIALSEIILAAYCLRTNRFGKTGFITIVISVLTVMLWSYYYFFL